MRQAHPLQGGICLRLNITVTWPVTLLCPIDPWLTLISGTVSDEDIGGIKSSLHCVTAVRLCWWLAYLQRATGTRWPLIHSARVFWTPQGQSLSLISSVVSCTSQAPSKRSAHPDPRASATPPASHHRTSWHCQGSALHGTSSGSPMEPSPIRSSSLQTHPHHPPRLPLCHLGMPGKVRAWGMLVDLTSWLLVCFKWQNMEHTVRDSLKSRLVSQAPLVEKVVSWVFLVCYLAVSACELCVPILQKKETKIKR